MIVEGSATTMHSTWPVNVQEQALKLLKKFIYKFALYAHCALHRLNLCAGASCQVQDVRNMMDNVRVILTLRR